MKQEKVTYWMFPFFLSLV